MKRVILMQGISGSGKSTAAGALVRSVHGGIILSADDFLIEDGKYVHDETRVRTAHSRCFHAYTKALRSEVPLVIVDNTNLKWKNVRRYVDVAVKRGYETCLARVECDPVVAAFRNTHGVPAATVRLMSEQLAAFQVPEGYTVPILSFPV